MNFIHIAGHLGADPETRFTSTGKKVTTLRVATRTRKGQHDDTIWWRVTIWGEQYDKMLPYLKKGSPVIVAGEVQKPEIFTDREGKPQISLDITAVHIQFSPFGKPGSGTAQEGQVPSHQNSYSGSAGGHGTAAFGSSSEGSSNPYASPGHSPIAARGDTLDDNEVPF